MHKTPSPQKKRLSPKKQSVATPSGAPAARATPSQASRARSPSPEQRLAMQNRFTQQMLEQGDIARLQILLKERDIELEHKMNTLVALNDKLSVFKDLKKDVEEN